MLKSLTIHSLNDRFWALFDDFLASTRVGWGSLFGSKSARSAEECGAAMLLAGNPRLHRK